MLEKKSGMIVNVSSTNAIDTYYPESCDYDASKAGVISLTHNLAREFAPNIRVNCVCPGWVNTDMNKELTPDIMEYEKEKILRYLYELVRCIFRKKFVIMIKRRYEFCLVLVKT